MSQKNYHWAGLSYLEALRPDPGWSVDTAVLATYSADLAAVVASLLALAGLDDERGSGSKVDFATAYEELRGKVRVIAQAGRIQLPKRTPAVAAILDRFFREVAADETQGSWHPKVALVRYRGTHDPDEVAWRLWVGSRNLTVGQCWDAGLVLTGAPHGRGRSLAGVPGLARTLLNFASLDGRGWADLEEEVRALAWESPAGVHVEDVWLMTGADDRGLPSPPARLSRLAVVSPFLDGRTVQVLGTWGESGCERLLLSTSPELGRLAAQTRRPLGAYSTTLLLDDVAEDEGQASEEEHAGEPAGLHAKLIYVEHGRRRTLWLGSANATARGWQGPNVEVMARLRLQETAARGVLAFLETAQTVRPSELPAPAPADPEEERLELARKQVAARWRATQVRAAAAARLTCLAAPHPDDTDVALEVGLLCGESVPWPRLTTELVLPRSAAEESEFVQVTLRLGERACSWIACALLDPAPNEERDRRALARHLDPRTFLLWIRALLGEGDLSAGGGDWDEEPKSSRGNGGRYVGPFGWAPRIEDALKAFARDPQRLVVVDRTVRRYLDYVRQRPEVASDEERDALETFTQIWREIQAVLIPEQAHA